MNIVVPFIEKSIKSHVKKLKVDKTNISKNFLKPYSTKIVMKKPKNAFLEDVRRIPYDIEIQKSIITNLLEILNFDFCSKNNEKERVIIEATREYIV